MVMLNCIPCSNGLTGLYTISPLDYNGISINGKEISSHNKMLHRSPHCLMHNVYMSNTCLIQNVWTMMKKQDDPICTWYILSYCYNLDTVLFNTKTHIS